MDKFNDKLKKLSTLQDFIPLVEEAMKEFCYPIRRGIIIEDIIIRNDRMTYVLPYGNIFYRNNLITLKRSVKFVQKDRRYRDEGCILGSF